MSRYRKGENKPQKAGRAARTSIGVTTTRAHRARCLAALIARINQGKILVRDFLIGVGLDDEFVTRYESAFGKVAAKFYRQVTGQDPQRTGAAMVRGWMRNAFAYRAEHLGILFDALRTYKRTAALVAPAPTTLIGA